MKTTEPYSKLALIYDRLMDHVDYRQWSEYILELIHHSSRDVYSLIDLSCGTGSILSYLDKSIDIVYGSDRSKEMIFAAREKKISDVGGVFIGDLRYLAIRDSCFDCALVLYDSLNYLTDSDSLKRSLKEIHRILKKDGIFIFDIVSEDHCRKHYGDFHESEYWENDGYSRHSFYDSKTKFQFNEFRIVIRGRTYLERHQQKIYGVDYLKSMLKELSFDILGIYNDFSNDDFESDSGRNHFLCVRL
jgi:ubiquinone/menaquinone biosynthesis C-methylase UbiE